MLTKRLIVCLDVRNKKVTKGIKFQNNVDIGDPVELGRLYAEHGADELVFYDITASAEKRAIDLEMVEQVARKVFIPFAVGGGLRNVDDMYNTLMAGAEKVSLNSLAVRNPSIIKDGAYRFGSQCIVLGMDAKYVGRSAKLPSGYEVVIEGGRRPMGLDAVAWAKQAQDLGIGEICLNSIDADGTCAGYELNLTAMIADQVKVPVIASGGAGTPDHIVRLFDKTNASAALIASMVHYGNYTLAGIKEEMADMDIAVRQDW
jgi:cyclase